MMKKGIKSKLEIFTAQEKYDFAKEMLYSLQDENEKPCTAREFKELHKIFYKIQERKEQ